MSNPENHARVQHQARDIRSKVKEVLKQHNLQDFDLHTIELVRRDDGCVCRYVIGDDGKVHEVCTDQTGMPC